MDFDYQLTAIGKAQPEPHAAQRPATQQSSRDSWRRPGAKVTVVQASAGVGHDPCHADALPHTGRAAEVDTGRVGLYMHPELYNQPVASKSIGTICTAVSNISRQRPSLRPQAASSHRVVRNSSQLSVEP